ncbi:Guanylate cyclase [Seminavis robusta]|uniref:Guanylate cyclase n=1 Tax=Seminavis robusta TaxID=568900 RepID=A0A9N8F4S3_9STRA|nr:Guanylate cyclase [Seminavis robusta]|eukprot:Sro2979_g341440.1 Guanylate cyclase (276) ;mRNA; f:464-1362
MKLHNELVFTTIKPFANVPAEEHAKMHSNGAEGANNPHSFTFHPVHRVPGNQSSDIVAMFAVATAWDFSMQNLLPDNVKGMYCVLQNTCNQTVTYRIDGGNATYLGDGELQPSEFDDMAVFVDLNLQTHPDARSTPGHCMYSMKIYPSKAFESDYKTNTPAIYSGVVAGTFALIAIALLLYDRTVTQRNEKMIFQAAKTNAILAKFVPDHLRGKIMGFDDGSIGGGRRGPEEFNLGLMDTSKVDEMAKSMVRSMSDSRMSSSGVVNHTRRRDLDV